MSSTWIDGATAKRALDLPDVRAVDKLVEEGLIHKRSLPSVRARYLKADVEKLARLQLVPAGPTEAPAR